LFICIWHVEVLNAKVLKKLVIFLFLIVGFTANSQNYLKRADKKYRNKQLEQAIQLYYQAYLENPHNYRILKGLVLSSQQLDRTEEAENWMQKIVEQDRHTTTDMYLYAELLLANDKYNEAETWFTRFADLNPYDNKTKEGKEFYSWLKELKSKGSFKIVSVSLNTVASELGSCPYNDGIVFSSGGLDKNGLPKSSDANLDLYFAKTLQPSVFEQPQPFAEKVNTPYNDGPVSFDKTTGLMYVNRYAPKKAQFDEGELFYHMQIIVSECKDGIWRADEDFFFNNPKFTVCHPNVSSDGQILFFSSDINGGYGGADIYFCHKDSNGNWSYPYNIGPHVNSTGNEFFPFLGSDNTLYFSSDGHKGIGGYDVFKATPENGVFKNVINPGFGLNSARDDVSVFVDSTGNSGYVSSNRAGGVGLFDIYYFENQLIPVIVSGEVKDVETREAAAGILVEIHNEKGEAVLQAKTDTEGKFRFETYKNEAFSIAAKSDEFEFLENELEVKALKRGDELVLEVFLRKK
jgi:hypothetical protein